VTDSPAAKAVHLPTAAGGPQPIHPEPGIVPDEVQIQQRPFTSEDAGYLLARADAYNAQLYGHADESVMHSREFDLDHGGAFLIVYRTGRPVACGGLRRAHPPAPEGAAEVKRMFVVADERRRGLGRRLLEALESLASEAGYRQIVLDTGRKQDAAHGLYESCGYHRIPGFTIYRDVPGNRAYGKDLRPPE
jgi:GNAT superfamily N-acetyltransferase